MWVGRRFGSKRSSFGSRFVGDCQCPLLHKALSGLISPQNAGPDNVKSESKFGRLFEQGKKTYRYIIILET